MSTTKNILILAAIPMILLFYAVSFVGSQQRTYTEADMPKLMEATWNEDVMGGGADAEVIRSLLQRGQLIIINERPKKLKWLVTSGILANASPETIYKGYTDYAHYSNIMPATESASTKKLGPNVLDVTINHRVKIVKGVEIPASYTIMVYYRPPYRADWVKRAGDFEENSGFLQLVPVDGGKQTMIFFTVYNLPRMPILTNFIKSDPDLDLGVNISVASMVTRALKQYGERTENRDPFVPGKGMGGNIIDVMSKNPDTVNLLLNRGGMLLIEDGPPIWATTVTSMNVTPSEVFQSVTSFEKSHCLKPEMRKVEVKERTANSAKVWFNMVINPVVFTIDVKYTLAYTFSPPGAVSWKWAAGDMPSVKGSWTFLPLDGGKKTLAFFRITEDLKALPGLGGAGVRSAINVEPTLEPAILASQAMIMARGDRLISNMPDYERKAKMANCR